MRRRETPYRNSQKREVINLEPTSYDKIIEMVVTALTERGIHEQRNDNPEIEAMIQDQTELSIRVQDCLTALDADTKDLLIRYYEQAESIADEQIHYLYIQGAKDCVRLLKSLGIL